MGVWTGVYKPGMPRKNSILVSSQGFVSIEASDPERLECHCANWQEIVMSVFMAMIAGLKTEAVARVSLALENVALRQ